MSPEAVEHVLELARAREVAPVLRVRVVAGGCQGLTWRTELGESESRPGDRRRANRGVDVVVDERSEPYLRGGRLELERGGRTEHRTPLAGDDAAAVLRLRGLAERHVCCDGESFSPDIARR